MLVMYVKIFLILIPAGLSADQTSFYTASYQFPSWGYGQANPFHYSIYSKSEKMRFAHMFTCCQFYSVYPVNDVKYPTLSHINDGFASDVCVDIYLTFC